MNNEMRKDGVAGVDRMWDSQWVNVVNAPEVLRAETAEDAVNIAVKLTEQTMAANHAKASAKAGEQRAALLEACETFAEWLRREDEGLPAGIERGAPDGERRWREWWNENLRICALAQEQARAAIRQATEGEGNE